MDRIGRNSGYFITRLATNAIPCIGATHRQGRGRAIELEGNRIKEVPRRLQRDVFDVEVEVAFQRRVDAGIRRTVGRRLRLIAVRLPESTEYPFYLTDIDPDSFDPHAVAQTYAARWQIELIFKELKSHYRLDELPTSKAHIVETLLLRAVITLLVRRRALQAVRERLWRTPYKIPLARISHQGDTGLKFQALFIPSFYYQMTPKISLNARCSISISKNLSINGRTRSSDQLGIWSYNINP